LISVFNNSIACSGGITFDKAKKATYITVLVLLAIPTFLAMALASMT
jgi:hypothetical protein